MFTITRNGATQPCNIIKLHRDSALIELIDGHRMPVNLDQITGLFTAEDSIVIAPDGAPYATAHDGPEQAATIVSAMNAFLIGG